MADRDSLEKAAKTGSAAEVEKELRTLFPHADVWVRARSADFLTKGSYRVILRLRAGKRDVQAKAALPSG